MGSYRECGSLIGLVNQVVQEGKALAHRGGRVSTSHILSYRECALLIGLVNLVAVEGSALVHRGSRVSISLCFELRVTAYFRKFDGISLESSAYYECDEV